MVLMNANPLQGCTCGDHHCILGLNHAPKPGEEAAAAAIHPGVELGANLESISLRCHLWKVAFVWELTKQTIRLPLGCLHGGFLGADLGEENCVAFESG